MAITYQCPNCGFSYEIHFGETNESCPNCGTQHVDEKQNTQESATDF